MKKSIQQFSGSLKCRNRSAYGDVKTMVLPQTKRAADFSALSHINLLFARTDSDLPEPARVEQLEACTPEARESLEMLAWHDPHTIAG